MALASPQDSPAWATLVGYKPGYKVNLEHGGKPQERVDAKRPRAHHTDLEKHTRVYHPVHSAKNTGSWDLESFIQPRGSTVVGTTDTPPERCFLV